jgi:CHAD domain-containing protein
MQENTAKKMKTVKSLGDWATLGIAKHFEKIVKYEQDVLADREIEDLHQMRVGMRRLRSTMTSLGLALDLPKAAREQKVGKIARILGTLRDLDVLGQVLTTEYQPHLPKSEAQILAEVIEVLTTQRQEAFKKVKECLHDRLYLNFKQDLNTWLENPIYQPIGQILLSTVLPDLLLPQASRLLLHPGWLVGIDCQKTDIETLLQKQGIVLHELRKEAKRSRYNMELFTEFYGDIYQTYLRDIKEIQTVLGEIQDGFILAKFLTTVRGKNWKATMPTLVQKFQDIRALKWQEWQPLQDKFLQPQNRKEFHLSILNCS